MMLLAVMAVMAVNVPEGTPHIELQPAKTEGFWNTLGAMLLRVDESTTEWSYTNLLVCRIAKGHVGGKDRTVVGIMNKWYLWS